MRCFAKLVSETNDLAGQRELVAEYWQVRYGMYGVNGVCRYCTCKLNSSRLVRKEEKRQREIDRK